MNIIILEDKGGIAKDLSYDLEEKGYTVYIAYEVTEAIDLVNERKFEWFILDLNLPPTGMKVEEVKMTYGGIVTGFIYASKYLVTLNKVRKDRIIFFSKYLKELNQFANKKEFFTPDDLKGYYQLKKEGINFEKIVELISK